MLNLKLKGAIVGKFGSQSNFARAIGNSEVIVSRFVCGRHRLSKETQTRWAQALVCEVEEIFNVSVDQGK